MNELVWIQIGASSLFPPRHVSCLLWASRSSAVSLILMFLFSNNCCGNCIDPIDPSEAAPIYVHPDLFIYIYIYTCLAYAYKYD